MPIVFVHGVATRAAGLEQSWGQIESYLRHYAAPALAGDPGRVAIMPAYWGDVASCFRFGGSSRPRSPLLGQGSLQDAALPAALAAAEYAGLIPASPPAAGGLAAAGLVAAGPAIPGPRTPGAGGNAASVRDMPPDELSDLAAACAYAAAGDDVPAAWLIAADEAAHDPQVRLRLQQAPDDVTAQALYLEAVQQRVAAAEPGALAGMGAGSPWAQWRRRVAEAMDRGSHAPSFAVSRVLGEARGPVNTAASRFLGDIFVYLNSRVEGQGMGPIPRVVLQRLQEAGRSRVTADEPLVVVSHSMGGQIIYDLVTYFLPALAPADGAQTRVDFWCATASQVGLFLDLNLFLAADGGRAPLAPPSRRWLGGWWNVWDYNDFLSFSVRDIVRGVDDEAYSSGLSLVSAHSGYLRRPSFYRRLRAKLDDARGRDWDRSPAAEPS